MTDLQRQLEPVADLLRHASELDELERATARRQFLERVESEDISPKSPSVFGYAMALALAASLILAVVFWKTTPHGLTYAVVGTTSDGGYLQVSEGRQASVTFSDRTQITAEAGTRLRIDEKAQPNGARISLERGRLEAEVTHTSTSDWRFVAGPFTVRVTGTRFTLSWDADREQLELELLAGSVDISGYVGSGIASVRAGQRFAGDAKRRTMLVSDLSAQNATEAAPTTTEAQASASPSEPPTTTNLPLPTTSVSRAGTKLSWPELVAKGAFRQVVEQADARGTSNCLTSCNAEDLNSLADAARYVGKSQLAEQALLALRTRFSSSYGTRAAFLLGRLYENNGNLARAKSWYETLLREAPSSSFAAEALAGKMRTVNGLEGRAAARAVARDYLRLYPKGVHATSAQQLAEAP